MVQANRKKESLYEAAKSGLSSLAQQTSIVFAGFMVMLLLTKGNPPAFVIALIVCSGIAFVTWSEQSRLTKLQARNNKAEPDDGNAFQGNRTTRGNPYQHLVKRPVKIETADGSHHSVSIKTIEISAIVAPNGTLTLQLPPDITPGEHRITLLIKEE